MLGLDSKKGLCFKERFARGVRFGFKEGFAGVDKGLVSKTGLDSKKSLGCEERFTHLGFEERLRYINYSNQY